MFVSIQNTMALGIMFVLVACGLVGLAAMLGALLSRLSEQDSSIAARFAFPEVPSPGRRAGHAGREGTTAVYGDELRRTPGIRESEFARKTVVEESTHGG